MITAYVKKLREEDAARAASYVSPEQELQQRVAAVVGEGTTTRIPDLQRVLDSDPRAIGSALRALGFKRKRIWSGDDYALTCWRKATPEWPGSCGK